MIGSNEEIIIISNTGTFLTICVRKNTKLRMTNVGKDMINNV